MIYKWLINIWKDRYAMGNANQNEKIPLNNKRWGYEDTGTFIPAGGNVK